MLVTGIIPRGYCKGVVRAINIAKKATKEVEKKPLYILGMIVHNQYIVNALRDLGAITIEDKNKTREELLDEIDEGTVIITAHGAGDIVTEKALNKGLDVIDASCLDVIKTHDLIKAKLTEGFEILYIGKEHHPEAEGALLIDPLHIHLIQKKEDFDQLDPSKKYLLTNQTTMSLYDIYELSEYAKQKLPHVEIEQEICTATKIRQEAIRDLPDDVDLVIIVGDPHSNNTKKLASISRDLAHKDVRMIGSIEELNINDLKGRKHVAVSSGASTPTSLTNQIISYIEQFDENDPSTYPLPKIDYDKILK